MPVSLLTMVRLPRAAIVVVLTGGAVWWACAERTRELPVGSLPPAPTGTFTCSSRCGVERWAVKTLSDPDRQRVDLQPQPTSIAQLTRLDRPAHLRDNRRARPVETTVFQIDARLIEWRNEPDDDWHLLLADPDDPSRTLIAEIPHPRCPGVCRSGLAEWYAAARDSLHALLNERRPANEPPLLRVSGVGFFDRAHGQTAAAPNQLELHPVLRITHVPHDNREPDPLRPR